MIGSPGPPPGAMGANMGNGAPFKPVPPPKPKNYRPPVGGSGSNGAGMHHSGQWDNGVSITPLVFDCEETSINGYTIFTFYRNRFHLARRMVSIILPWRHRITIRAWLTMYQARRITVGPTHRACIRTIRTRSAMVRTVATEAPCTTETPTVVIRI